MRHHILIIALFVVTSVASYAQPTAAPFTPYAELPKAEQKARLKSPAVVEIAAPADKIAALLVRAVQAEGYIVTQSTPQSLWMTKTLRSTGASILGAMIGESGFRYEVAFTFSEFGGITTVSGDAWLTMQNAYGRQTCEPILQKKKNRIGFDYMLSNVKQTAELKPVDTPPAH